MSLIHGHHLLRHTLDDAAARNKEEKKKIQKEVRWEDRRGREPADRQLPSNAAICRDVFKMFCLYAHCLRVKQTRDVRRSCCHRRRSHLRLTSLPEACWEWKHTVDLLLKLMCFASSCQWPAPMAWKRMFFKSSFDTQLGDIYIFFS